MPRQALRVPGPAVLSRGATWHGEDRRAKGGEVYRAKGLTGEIFSKECFASLVTTINVIAAPESCALTSIFLVA